MQPSQARGRNVPCCRKGKAEGVGAGQTEKRPLPFDDRDRFWAVKCGATELANGHEDGGDGGGDFHERGGGGEAAGFLIDAEDGDGA